MFRQHEVSMAKTVRDKQLVIRIAAPLRCELERAAAEDSRTLSDKVRLVLVDWAADRAVQREQAAA
jgi:hypothetical protein